MRNAGKKLQQLNSVITAEGTVIPGFSPLPASCPLPYAFHSSFHTGDHISQYLRGQVSGLTNFQGSQSRWASSKPTCLEASVSERLSLHPEKPPDSLPLSLKAHGMYFSWKLAQGQSWAQPSLTEPPREITDA